VVGVLTFVTRELFVLFDGFTIPPQATEQWVDAGLEKFSKMRVRSRLIPAMSGCDWKTDVLDLAGKSWDDACPTVRRSPSCFTISSKEMRFTSSQVVQLARSLREGVFWPQGPELGKVLGQAHLGTAGADLSPVFSPGGLPFLAAEVRLEPGF
jgi:hypothetical protein